MSILQKIVFAVSLACILFFQPHISDAALLNSEVAAACRSSHKQYGIPQQLMEQALKGNANAAYVMAMRYYLLASDGGDPTRYGDPVALKLAIPLLELAMEQGHFKAGQLLMKTYAISMVDEFLPDKEERMHRLYHRLAELGGAHEWYQYGSSCWTKGEKAEGALWLKKAAQAGYLRAYSSMGAIYREGVGLRPDLVRAYAYLLFDTRHSAQDMFRFPRRREAYALFRRLSPAERAQAESFYIKLCRRAFNKPSLTLDDFIAICAGGSAQDVADAIAKGCNPRTHTLLEGPLINHMAFMGRAPIVLELARKGADVNARDDAGISVLSWLSRYGETKAIKSLAALGADLNTCDAEGNTALHWASEHGDTSVVAALLAAGADVNPHNNRNVTPLMLALRCGHSATADLLRQRGATLPTETPSGAIQPNNHVGTWIPAVPPPPEAVVTARRRVRLVGVMERQEYNGKTYLVLRRDDGSRLWSGCRLGDNEELDRAYVLGIRTTLIGDALFYDDRSLSLDGMSLETDLGTAPANTLRQRLHSDVAWRSPAFTLAKSMLDATSQALEKVQPPSLARLRQEQKIWLNEGRRQMANVCAASLPVDMPADLAITLAMAQATAIRIEELTTLISTPPYNGLYKNNRGKVLVWLMWRGLLEVHIYPGEEENCRIRTHCVINPKQTGWIPLPHGNRAPIYILFTKKGLHLLYEDAPASLDCYRHVDISGFYPLS